MQAIHLKKAVFAIIEVLHKRMRVYILFFCVFVIQTLLHMRMSAEVVLGHSFWDSRRDQNEHKNLLRQKDEIRYSPCTFLHYLIRT